MPLWNARDCAGTGSMQTKSAIRLVMLRSACALFTLLFTGTGLAQNYPVKIVRLVAPYPPGGPNDIIARIIAHRMTQTLGQT